MLLPHAQCAPPQGSPEEGSTPVALHGRGGFDVSNTVAENHFDMNLEELFIDAEDKPQQLRSSSMSGSMSRSMSSSSSSSSSSSMSLRLSMSG